MAKPLSKAKASVKESASGFLLEELRILTRRDRIPTLPFGNLGPTSSITGGANRLATGGHRPPLHFLK